MGVRLGRDMGYDNRGIGGRGVGDREGGIDYKEDHGSCGGFGLP